MFSRRHFLRSLTTSGVGLLLGPLSAGLSHWRDRGTALHRVHRQSLVMGSVASFDVVAPHEEDAYAAINRAVDVFRRIERRVSMYRSDSETATLENVAGGAPQPVSDDTANILRRAQAVARATNGRFDVTVEPLMRRWGFRSSPEEAVPPPTREELERARALVGFHQLQVENGRARLQTPGMAIDVGGIAGGYALDQALDAMQTVNVAAALINFSGDVHCFGRPARTQPWTVHLVDPDTLAPLDEAISLHDEALSTSGSYQNRRHGPNESSWGHLLRPEVATPVEPVGSVTAIHSSACTADAWSTALYLGAESPPSDLRTIRLSATTSEPSSF